MRGNSPYRFFGKMDDWFWERDVVVCFWRWRIGGGFYYMRIFEGMRMERWVGGWRRCGAYREIEIYEE